jgi:uncharacterized protein with GYD domain
MLFVVIHSHTPELCPADNPAPLHQMASEQHIRESGVRPIGSYIAPPEHTMYFVLEADDYSQVVRYLRPLIKIGTPRIVPVQALTEALQLLSSR